MSALKGLPPPPKGQAGLTLEQVKAQQIGGVQPSFKASIGGAETVLPNIAKTFGNIPSSAAGLIYGGIVKPAENIGKSLGAIEDIYKTRGLVGGTKDIIGGFGETLKKGADIYRGMGEKIYGGLEKSVVEKGIVLGGISAASNDAVESAVTKVATAGIEDPLLLPSIIYGGPKVAGAKTTDAISSIARPIITGAETASEITGVTKAIGKTVEKAQEVVPALRAKAVDSLEETYREIMSGTTLGKKKLSKLEQKTEMLNRAGTEGVDPARGLAEKGIIPNREGTKLDTFEQANELRATARPLQDVNRKGLSEIPTLTSLDDVEKAAIASVRTPKNIAAGLADDLEVEVVKEFAKLKKAYPNGVTANQLDEIKAARWDNVFGNKSLIEADKLRKNTDYAIAKTMQKKIEQLADAAGNPNVAQLNREIGNILEQSKFLEDLNGKTVKGGRLLKYMTTLIGAGTGETIPGKVLGALGGNLVGELMLSSTIANPVKRVLLSNLKAENPKVYEDTIKWLTKQKLDRETRLLLPAPAPLGTPSNPRIMPDPRLYTPSGATVNPKMETPTAAKTLPVQNPKTGKMQTVYTSQSKSPTSQQTKPAITTAIKNPMGSSVSPLGKNVKGTTPNKQGGFISTGYKETGNLTTKILKDLEGKTTVSKQYILDATNRGELKQVERDLIRNVLETEKGDTINVADFAKKVKSELLPLKAQSSLGGEPRYESVTLPDEIRGNVRDYSENVYESPIKTSAGKVHFGDEMSDNYFGHTRIEDMADNKTRRVIEVQSDLYQKGNLEREIGNAKGAVEVGKYPDAQKVLNEKQKLQQYNDPTAHFRMVREEIKKAAQDGKTKLQFPTGETAMRVEGLGERNVWNTVKKVNEDGVPSQWSKTEISDLKVGQEIMQEGSRDNWIITDVLGDGKFKAMPKEHFDSFAESKGVQDLTGQDLISYAEQHGTPNFWGSKETFDISGKVDTNNPIYKFYEKDMQKYLNKFGGKRVVDENGVSWIEIPITKAQGEAPVEAFGKIKVNPLFVGAALGTGGALGATYIKDQK